MSSEPLNYRASASAVYYRPKRRFDVGRVVLGFAMAAAMASGGAALYAIVLPKIDDFYGRLAGVACGVIAVGLIALVPVKFGRVRTSVLAAGLGAGVGCVAVYAMWVVWTYRVLVRAGLNVSLIRLATRPIDLFDVIVWIGHIGTWSHHGDVVNGLPLYIAWLTEIGLMIGAGTLIAAKNLYTDDPVCGECQTRCLRTPRLPRFSGDRRAEVVTAVEGRSFDALVDLPAAPHEDDPEVTLKLMSCPRCKSTHVLTVRHVAWVAGRNGGQPSVQTVALIDQLLLPQADAIAFLAACEACVRKRTANTQKSVDDAS